MSCAAINDLLGDDAAAGAEMQPVLLRYEVRLAEYILKSLL